MQFTVAEFIQVLQTLNQDAKIVLPDPDCGHAFCSGSDSPSITPVTKSGEPNKLRYVINLQDGLCLRVNPQEEEKY